MEQNVETRPLVYVSYTQVENDCAVISLQKDVLGNTIIV